jgi:D-alanine-D-alanine ligase
MKTLRILMLMDPEFVPPDTIEGLTDEQIAPFKLQYDVYSTLASLGHEVHKLGVNDDLAKMRDAINDVKPHVAFNLLEGFRDFHVYDQHVVSYLELIDQPYTGCNPRGLTLARDKALTKKIMAYHRIRCPAFAVFPRRRKIVRPPKLGFPLLVKSVNVEGSVGIAQASIVYDDDKLRERVQFIHEQLDTSAIAEQYIEGREIYVGVMGNNRLKTFPAWELIFEKMPEDAHRIATDKVKWDKAYQKRWGITSRKAENLPPGHETFIPKLCKRIYRILGLTGYARLDFRMTESGELYLIEANPNPNLAYGEDFAESAAAAGIDYSTLLQNILHLATTYSPRALA